VKFKVPLTAQLFYDPDAVELAKIVESLHGLGCDVAVDRIRFGIPLRPLFAPQIWKSKIARLSKGLPGVIDAAIDFGKSLISVTYMPDLLRPSAIHEALLGRKRLPVESETQNVGYGDFVDIPTPNLNLGRVGNGDVDSLSFVETRVAEPCRCEASNGMAA